MSHLSALHWSQSAQVSQTYPMTASRRNRSIRAAEALSSAAQIGKPRTFSSKSCLYLKRIMRKNEILSIVLNSRKTNSWASKTASLSIRCRTSEGWLSRCTVKARYSSKGTTLGRTIRMARKESHLRTNEGWVSSIKLEWTSLRRSASNSSTWKLWISLLSLKSARAARKTLLVGTVSKRSRWLCPRATHSPIQLPSGLIHLPSSLLHLRSIVRRSTRKLQGILGTILQIWIWRWAYKVNSSSTHVSTPCSLTTSTLRTKWARQIFLTAPHHYFSWVTSSV